MEAPKEETSAKPDEVQEEALELEVQLKRMKELRKPVPVEGLPLETQQLMQLLSLHVDYQNLH